MGLQDTLEGGDATDVSKNPFQNIVVDKMRKHLDESNFEMFHRSYTPYQLLEYSYHIIYIIHIIYEIAGISISVKHSQA